MPHKPRRESSTRFYHIYVRGINKEKIFGQPREKNYFKRIIRKYLKEYDVEIYSYCIMSNHAHLLSKSDLKELSMFMSKVLAKYAQYYNYKNNRNGHVFQNRFGSECIESERYFWNCLKYIHMNPVKACMVSGLMDYKYSSIKYYMNEIVDILHENAIKHYKMKFHDWKEFQQYHQPQNPDIFMDSKEEVYIQRKEKALLLLWELQKEKGVENAMEILEEGELRKVYKKRLKEELKISNKMLNKIYDELKLKIIG